MTVLHNENPASAGFFMEVTIVLAFAIFTANGFQHQSVY